MTEARGFRIVPGARSFDRDEEADLVRRAVAGDRDALHVLVVTGFPAVLALARSYRGRGIPTEDLVGEGLVGLVEAVSRFDPDRGTRFSTFAGPWIRKRVLLALYRQTKVVTPSAYAWVRRRRETAAGKPVAPLVRIERLDDPVGPGSPETRLGRQADPRVVDAETELVRAEALRSLRRFVVELPERERAILASRFGLDGSPPKTLVEIGARMGLSRERVRQIERSAILRLHARIEEAAASGRA